MFHSRQIPTRIVPFLTVLSLLLALRITTAVDGGLAGNIVLRTYLFWAIVCAPVAYLVDMVGRTVLEYRIVRLVVARVRSDR